MTAAPESTPRLPAPAPFQRTAGHRVRTSMTRREWTRAGGMAAVILALHVIGWFTLVAIVAPQHHTIGARTFGVGIGVTAYTLGMRHAFDADHIAGRGSVRCRSASGSPSATPASSSSWRSCSPSA